MEISINIVLSVLYVSAETLISKVNSKLLGLILKAFLKSYVKVTEN